MKKINLFALTILAFMNRPVFADVGGNQSVNVGFSIPTLSDVVAFMVKFLIFFAGLAALLYLLLGAFAWVTSSGDKENVKKAQDKIQAAVIGLVLVVAVLVILVTLEQIVLKNAFCVGLTCNLGSSIPTLIK